MLPPDKAIQNKQELIKYYETKLTDPDYQEHARMQIARFKQEIESIKRGQEQENTCEACQ